MKKLSRLVVCTVILLFTCLSVHAGEKATAQEVIQKVYEAVEYISKVGESGFKEFNDPNSKWVWGGTYVFIMKCEPFPGLVTHPIKPKLIGKDLSKLTDKTGNYFFIQLCEVTTKPKGGWVEYLWPKPGEKEASRKISFCRQIPGTPYQAGAGLYDESISMEELNQMAK